MKSHSSWLPLVTVLLVWPWWPGCTCDDPLARVYPSLVVTPSKAELDNVPVAKDTDIVFTIVNQKQIRVNDIVVALDPDRSDPAFRLDDNFPTEVAAGQTGEITVTVRPRTVATITAVLVVTAEEDAIPNRVEIPITVNAIDAGLPDIEVTPNEIVFGPVGRNDVAGVDVDVSNVGDLDLVLDCVYFVPTGEDDLAARAAGCPVADTFAASPIRLATPVSGSVLIPSSTASLRVNFAPTDVLTHTGELVLLSSDPDESEIRIPATGTGSECPTAQITFVDDNATDIAPFDTVRLSGEGSTPVPGSGGVIETYAWSIAQRPVGSTAILSSDFASATELPVDLAGRYEVSLHVFDNFGIRSCEPAIAQFDVVPEEDLVVQLVWDHPDADLDLHTVRADGDIFTHDDDVYFSNRAPVGAPWSDNPDENPNLDHDDDEGYGPENMNIKSPVAGSRYRLFVHYWNKQTDLDARCTATLRVFAFGQQVLETTYTFENDQTLWRAVDLEWAAEEFVPPAMSQPGIITEYARPF